MFAFALWDRESGPAPRAGPPGREAALLRPVGPTRLFGSELKALRAHRAFGPTSTASRGRLLALKYVPAPGRSSQDVKKLPPATFLAIPAGRRGPPRTAAYWSPAGADRRERRSAVGRARRRARGAARASVQAPDDRRRAARRVPVRRHRLVDRRGLMQRSGAPGADLHDRLRRRRLRRGPPRPGRGRAPRHRSHRAGPQRRRGPGRDPRPGRPSTTSRSPTPRRCRPSSSPGWPAATSPWRCPATAATSCSAATTATWRCPARGAGSGGCRARCGAAPAG